MAARRITLRSMALVLVLAGCQKPAEEPRAADPVVKSKSRAEHELTVEEVKGYLDGKILDVSMTVAKEKPGAISYTMHKAGITALKVGNGASVNNAPWIHEITFLYDTGMGDTFAVIADVEHRFVEDRPAFFGFTVKRVVKQ